MWYVTKHRSKDYLNTNLEIVFCPINTWVWSSTAHFVVDAPSTSIVSLKTFAAAVYKKVL